jgi:hypothetical protein
MLRLSRGLTLEEKHEQSALPSCHTRRLWRQPAAACRLVCRGQPCRTPAFGGGRGDKITRKCGPRPHQCTGAGSHPCLRGYGHPSPAGPRQCRGRHLPTAADHDGSLLTLLHRSRLFFEDLPEIHRRRERNAHNEVLREGHAESGPVTICRISISNQAAG